MLSANDVLAKPPNAVGGIGAKAPGAGHPPGRLGGWPCVSLLLALVCGGCSDMVIVHSDFNTNRDVQNHLAYATNGYAMKTLVKGNPFPGPMDTFATAVTAAMNGANPGPPVRFSADPSEPNLKPYLVVMQFNPAKALQASQLCAGSSQGDEAPAAGKLVIAAGFCLGDDALSEARAEVNGVSGPDDPRFREAVQELTYFLFPPDEPQGDWDSAVPGS